MAKQPIDKDRFYSELTSMIELAQKSISFYSVSCCFGFYSRGLSNFEMVLRAIKNALSRQGARYLDVKVLVKIDRDNPIDMYAAERLAQLEKRYVHTGIKHGERNVFRELGPDLKPIQFLIIDDQSVLVSAIQEEVYNEDLDLVLNKSEQGVKFEKEDSPDEFNQNANLFGDTWQNSSKIEVQLRSVSRRKMKHLLETYKGTNAARTERELQLLLMGYLQGLYDPSIVDLETPTGGTQIDLLVGKRPHASRQGIEVKFGIDNDAIHQVVGQIRNYRKDFEDVLLVVGKPKYTPQRRADLVDELGKVDVGLVELL